MSFLNYYYIDVFGISAAAVGMIIFVTRTWDWINDPIMGMIADRTRTRMGKFRPWLLWVLPFWVVLGILTFTDFDLSPQGKVVYAFITYTLLTMAYTAINVPYSALMGVMSSKSVERTKLSSYRFIGAFIGVSIVNGSMLLLVKYLGGGNEQLGFTLTVSIYAALSAAAFAFTFWATKERVAPPKTQKSSIRNDLMPAARNGPWRALFCISVCTIMWIAIRNGATLYYFKYVSGSEHSGSLFLTVGTFMQIAGVTLTAPITRLLGGKRRAFVILTLSNAAMLATFFYLPPDKMTLIIIHQIVCSFVTVPLMPMFWSMIADTADYGQWKLGQRSTGLIFSTGTTSMKLGWSIGPAVSLWLLAFFGFEANADGNHPSRSSHAHELDSGRSCPTDGSTRRFLPHRYQDGEGNGSRDRRREPNVKTKGADIDLKYHCAPKSFNRSHRLFNKLTTGKLPST